MPDIGAIDFSKQSAQDVVKGVLDQYGLGDLATGMYGQWKTTQNPDLAYLWLRQQPQYKSRFPAMDQRQKAGLPAISETDYMNWETTTKDLFRMYGLPKDFYDSPEDFTSFIAGDVSPAELKTRVEQGYIAAQSAPQETQEQLARLYGIGPGGLAAYYLDPDKALPALQRQFQSAQIAGAAQRTGFGQLGQSEAERLQQLGVSAQGAQQGFGQLTAEQQITGALPGETQPGMSREAQLAATFGGDAAAQQELERRARQRGAVFQSGGQVATGSQGVLGLQSTG